MGKFLSSRSAADLHSNSISRHTLQQHDDSQLLGEVKLNGFPGEAMQTIEHANPYGFSTYPKGPSMVGGVMRYAVAFMSFLTGNRSHGVAMQIGDRRFRMFNKKEGEVAVHDDQGQWAYFRRSGVLVKVPNGNTVTLQVDEQQQQQGGQGGGSQGGSQGGNSGMGQDATKIPSSVASIVMKKDSITLKVGSSEIVITGSQIYAKSSAIVTDGPTYLNKGTCLVMVKSAMDSDGVYAPSSAPDPLLQAPMPSGQPPAAPTS